MEIQINTFLIYPNVFLEKKSGFCDVCSCATDLIEFTDHIFHSRDNNRSSLLIMLDDSNAFDMLNDEILLVILKFIGFSVSALFLTSRVQRVLLGGRLEV